MPERRKGVGRSVGRRLHDPLASFVGVVLECKLSAMALARAGCAMETREGGLSELLGLLVARRMPITDARKVRKRL